MGVRLFGMVAVDTSDGLVEVRGAKQRLLLAVLGSRPGERIEQGRLLEALWPAGSGARSVAALQTQVSRLRGVLAPLGEDVLVGEHGTYRLAVGRETVDVAAFAELVQAGQAALRDDDPARAVEVFERALGMVVGAPFAELSDHPALVVAARHLDELVRVARQGHASGLVATGRHGEAVALLGRHVDEHPLDESAWAALMTAQYRAGRASDALTSYRQLTEVLAEQVGAEPSPQLQELHEQILRHDPQLTPTPAAEPAVFTSAADVVGTANTVQQAGGVRGRDAGQEGIAVRVGRPAGRASLGARLEDVRERAFVGRTEELDRFRAALDAELPPFAVLVVHGPGGVGKSALLARFAQQARDAGRDPVHLDARSVEPTPQGLQAALAEVLGVAEDRAVVTLAERERAVVLLDTYERLAHLDGWLRHTLLPQLREDVLVVLAGRHAPEAGWRSDPGWQDLVEEVSLRDLQPDPARELLTARGVPADRHDEALAVAHGHPLALVLAAEVLRQQPDGEPFSLDDAPDVMHVLLRRFVEEVPSPAHRDALLACAHASAATEAMLREVVDDDASDALFRWLRELPFSELLPEGVGLHALVADVLDAEARWRDPEHYEQLHRRLSQHLHHRIAGTVGRARQRRLWLLIQLHRFNPVARRFFDFDADEDVWVEAATSEDHDAIVEMTGRHEGGASADLARWWLQRQPEAFQVFRTPRTRRPTGYLAHLRLGDAPGDEVHADPVAAAAWHHVRATAPMRPGEQLLLLRFWVDEQTHQDVATHHLVSTSAALDWIGTPGLAWSFVVLCDAAFWEPIFDFIDFHRLQDGDVAVGDHRVGMFARDWRTTSVAAWVDLMTERQLSRAASPRELPAQQNEQLLVLSEEEFTDAVRDALRGYARPDGLDGNPLLRSRLVVEQAGEGPRTDALARLLEEATEALADHPRDERRRRAVQLAHLAPAPTQEAAAERLDLPYSTFRRHLTEGVDHVVTWLWERELHGHAART